MRQGSRLTLRSARKVIFSSELPRSPMARNPLRALLNPLLHRGELAMLGCLERDKYSTVSARTDSVAVYVTLIMAQGSCEADLWQDHLHIPESCAFSLYLNGFGAPCP
jgi:hypothetical protein